MKFEYDNLFNPNRIRQTTIGGRKLLQESLSDHSRIVFASSFRRLQQKAQVFSLEKNPFVRSRMTHSIEVADYGKDIATQIAQTLISTKELNLEEAATFVQIVENACLMHDIGNPPFGHFGEKAIQKWFKDNWEETFKKSFSPSSPIDERYVNEKNRFEKLINDFLEFDGNPQGFRIVTRILGKPFEVDRKGLNLTYQQLYCALKYVRVANGKEGNGPTKKAGYFNSEQDVVDEIKKAYNIDGELTRYPLTYLMEVADDIAYCLSDMEDGIEKDILTNEKFREHFMKEWVNYNNQENVPLPIVSELANKKDKEIYFYFKTTLARELIKLAADTFLERKESIMNGKANELFEVLEGEHLDQTIVKRIKDAQGILQCLRNVSKKYLFRSHEAENKEIAGYYIISSLMERYSTLLKLSEEKFSNIVEALEKPKAAKGLDVEWRIFHTLPEKYVRLYEEDKNTHSNDRVWEWFCRAHLIVDYISGMTDDYSLKIYNLFNGIALV